MIGFFWNILSLPHTFVVKLRITHKAIDADKDREYINKESGDAKNHDSTASAMKREGPEVHTEPTVEDNRMKHGHKLRYSITDVSEMCGVNVWTLRLWCNRFSRLRPRLSKKGNLVFTPTDVEKIKLINRLAQKHGTTLDEVRKHLDLVHKQDHNQSTQE